MTIERINLPAMVFEVGASPEEWQVEAIDDAGDGACYVTTFSGPYARARAHDYAKAAFARIDPVPDEMASRVAEQLEAERNLAGRQT